MRIVLNDTEWYYGRYILVAIVLVISIIGGIGLYLWEQRQPTTQDTSKNKLMNNEKDTETISINQTNLQENSIKHNEIITPIQPEKTSSNDRTNLIHPNYQNSERNTIQIAVAIQGAIRKPGLYRLNEGSRLQDLIDIAGGTLENAETRYLNLAAPLIDGTTIIIPEKLHVQYDGQVLRAKGTSTPPTIMMPNSPLPTIHNQPTLNNQLNKENSPSTDVQTYTSSHPNNLIDLNTASQQELESLPGIGPALAQAIIKYREAQPFYRVEDLMNVPGIGPKRFEKIRDLVTVNPQ